MVLDLIIQYSNLFECMFVIPTVASCYTYQKQLLKGRKNLAEDGVNPNYPVERLAALIVAHADLYPRYTV